MEEVILLLSTEFETLTPGTGFRSTPSNPLPQLPTLRHQLLRRFDPQNQADERRALALDLEFLPYALVAAKGAVERFIEAQEDLVRQAFPEGSTCTERRQLDWWELGHAIDSFLDAAVKTQDAMIKYWRARFTPDLPRSLNDLMKGHRAKLPRPILRNVEAYWEKSGKLVRTYRDCSQHFAIVASEVDATPSASGGFAVRALLANNPEAKSTFLLKYYDPEVPAFQFLEVHFRNLLSFAYSQTRMMLFEDDPEAGQLTGQWFRISKRIGGASDPWYKMFSREEFHRRIEEFQAELDQREWPQQVAPGSE